MQIEIIKRDGSVEKFNRKKIMTAIKKAFNEPQKFETTYNILADEVIKRAEHKILDGQIEVETIQDIVEDVLMDTGHTDVAKRYILYRAARSEERERKTKIIEIYDDITFSDSKSTDLKRENANVNCDTAMGSMLKYGSEGAKSYFEKYIIPPSQTKAHKNGDIHIHDMDFYTLTTTCTQIDILELFKDGFSTGHGFLREPNDIQSYSALACIAIQSNQNDQHGGQSIPNFDYGLAPGVMKTYRTIYGQNFSKAVSWIRPDIDITEDEIQEMIKNIRFKHGEWPTLARNPIYDAIERDSLISLLGDDFARIKKLTIDATMKETNRKTYQAMEALVHNLNTMSSRAGAQVPFSSINYGTDTSPEGRMVIENIMLANEAGLGFGETPIFPIHIFKVKEGVNYNPEDPNYDLFKLAMRVSSKRMFPNFSFLDAPFNKQYYVSGRPETEVAYMGCVDANECISYIVDGIEIKNVSIKSAFNHIKSWMLGNKKLTNYLNFQDKSEYIDTSKENMKILDGGKWTQLLGILVNDAKKSTKMVELQYVVGGKNRYFNCTEDHPLMISGKGRLPVNQIVINEDKILLTTGEECLVTGIKQYDERKESYDVETESDTFDVSGIRSHNCRTRVIGNVYDPENEITFGRGNLSFTSINLPRIAINSKGDIDAFFKKLKNKLKLVVKQLSDRFEIQAKKKVMNYPSLMGQGIWLDSKGLKPDDEVGEVLKHGTLSIGFIGLAEALVSLVGKHHGESKESQEIGLKIVKFMRDYVDEVSQNTRMNYTLIATPAEGLSGRFVKIDKEKYGIIEGVTDREYYTNSFHIPVHFKTNAIDKIKLEAPYHALTNAGHITYVELDGEAAANLEAFEALVRAMKENGIGYGAINHPVDRDPKCGYTGILNGVCPKCGRYETDDEPFSRIRRITGYLVGTLDRFNNAKKAEERDRIKHNI